MQRTTMKRAGVIPILSALLFGAPDLCRAQATTAGPPSIGAVFREVPGDLWRFLSWDTGLVLGIGGGAAAIGHIWDDDLAGEIETNVRLNDAMQPGHTYGSFEVQALVGIGLYSGG